MKRIILMGSGFKGEVHLLYNLESILATIDFQFAELSLIQIDWLKQRIPVVFDATTFNPPQNVTYIVDDIEIDFEMFWEKFKGGANKKRCIPLWDKLSKAKKIKCYVGAIKYMSFLEANKWRPKMGPDRWIQKEEWENEWK